MTISCKGKSYSTYLSLSERLSVLSLYICEIYMLVGKKRFSFLKKKLKLLRIAVLTSNDQLLIPYSHLSHLATQRWTAMRARTSR